MPRFFLNIEHYDGQRWQDEDGADFATLQAAVAEAREVVLELVIEAMRDVKARVPLRVVTFVHGMLPLRVASPLKGHEPVWFRRSLEQRTRCLVTTTTRS